MQVRVIEDRAVAAAGAVMAVHDDNTIVVIDPDLTGEEKYRLLRELLEP